MHPLVHLANFWAGVFRGRGGSRKSPLTPVLLFLSVGFLLVSFGLLPVATAVPLTIASLRSPVQVISGVQIQVFRYCTIL